MPTQLMDLEDPAAIKGKSMVSVDRSEWPKDVAALAELGVHLKADHMDGYLYQPQRKEENLDKKPWETELMDGIPRNLPRYRSVDEWNNPDFNLEIENGVAYMTLNRPDANNAINRGIEEGLSNACDILENRPDVRVAILTAVGRMFCAGADPKSFDQGAAGDLVDVNAPPSGASIVGGGRSDNKRPATVLAGTLYRFAKLPQFTIVCVNGSVMGSGVGYLCTCDMVIAVKTAYITTSEVKLGILPATMSPHVVARTGVTKAKRLFCAAENVTASQAAEMGLVQEVVENTDGFAPIIQDVCKRIAALSPASIKASKDIIMRLMNCPMSNSLLEYTAEQYAEARKGVDAEAAMNALVEKKRPPWMETPLVPRC